ncbi:hypothetical protein C9427_30845 [Mesorhizobium helmanticense]|uniref:Tn3 transposase DDE domain-containing protein n=1 Tax=Mesorhizobium helmanticense TaxID=1776423 RepID=A0A2T4ILU2_9HYPH|nr:hypothetical protein C9427_30845 [Mesorhizobium helmanticense]
MRADFSIRSATWPISQLRADQAFLSPVTAIYWNTLDIARVVDAMRAAGEGIPDHLLASLSPLDAQGFRPIQFTL